MAAKLAVVANHPNRSKSTRSSAGNPSPRDVRYAREQAGLTQEAFGDLVYKGWRTVQDWESGERRMPPDTWELAQVKLRARELLKRGRIAPLALKDLGLEISED